MTCDKILVFICMIALCCTSSFAQPTIDSLKNEINKLERLRIDINLKLGELNSLLSSEIAKQTEGQSQTSGVINTKCISKTCYLLRSAYYSNDSDIILTIPLGEIFQITYDTHRYHDFFPAEYNGNSGYVYKNVFKLPKQRTKTDNQDPVYSAPTKTYKSSGSANGNSRTILTGPRGGRYYINKNGKKTYVKH